MTTTDPAEVLREYIYSDSEDEAARLEAVLDAALAAAYQRGKNEALNGPRIGVRLRDAFWVDSQHYDHYHDHGDTVTHEVGEWCPHQLIGQNYPCPPVNDAATQTKAEPLDAQADRP